MTELVVKKSRFIAYAAPVKTEAEALAFVKKIAKENKRARHAVYAYIADNKEKQSDDGEPRGTAGMPVLTSIKSRSLTDITVVVVRYFGGVLLGKGGLIRAYGKAAGKELDRYLSEDNEK